MSMSENNSDLIEDIPNSWAKLVTQRIIFRAQIKAKVTQRAESTMKIVCKMPASGSFSKWLKDY